MHFELRGAAGMADDWTRQVWLHYSVARRPFSLRAAIFIGKRMENREAFSAAANAGGLAMPRPCSPPFGRPANADSAGGSSIKDAN
jgi:hypothetical protein